AGGVSGGRGVRFFGAGTDPLSRGAVGGCGRGSSPVSLRRERVIATLRPAAGLCGLCPACRPYGGRWTRIMPGNAMGMQLL
ncbi:hypothetical protein, partial [Novacetimonas hansenii]